MGLRWVWKECLDDCFAVLSVTNPGRRGRERTHPSALARPLASPAAGCGLARAALGPLRR